MDEIFGQYLNIEKLIEATQDGEVYYLHLRVVFSQHHLDANQLTVHVASKSEHRSDMRQVLVAVVPLR